MSDKEWREFVRKQQENLPVFYKLCKEIPQPDGGLKFRYPTSTEVAEALKQNS